MSALVFSLLCGAAVALPFSPEGLLVAGPKGVTQPLFRSASPQPDFTEITSFSSSTGVILSKSIEEVSFKSALLLMPLASSPASFPTSMTPTQLLITVSWASLLTSPRTASVITDVSGWENSCWRQSSTDTSTHCRTEQVSALL
jgi:hypothetical protein